MLILSLQEMLIYQTSTSEVKDLITILLAVIPLAAAVRATWILSTMSHAEEGELPGLKRQLKNILLFVVIAETIVGTLSVISGYFRGG